MSLRSGQEQASPSWFVPFKHRKAAPLREEFLNCEQKAGQGEYLYSTAPGCLVPEAKVTLGTKSFKSPGL